MALWQWHSPVELIHWPLSDMQVSLHMYSKHISQFDILNAAHEIRDTEPH